MLPRVGAYTQFPGRRVVCGHYVLSDALWCASARAGSALSRVTRDTTTIRNEAVWRWYEPREDAAGDCTVPVAACLERNARIFFLQEGTMLRAASAGLTFPANPKVAPLSVICRQLHSSA